MNYIFLIILAVIFISVINIITVIYLLNKKSLSSKENSTLLEWIKSMQTSMNSNSLNMTKILQENSKQLNERLDRTALVIGDVTREIGKMSEIGHSMQEIQDFLKSPKLRGNLGEQVLNDLITQIFPKNTFNLQYSFKTGDKVDAVIKTDAGILPIDAKFPMENFQKMTKAKNKEDLETYKKDFIRDIKKHIETISRKYILPDEGTMDFALMYVPSENVFYEIVNEDEILEYAKTKRVYVVSPSTLYAHLQTILLSFEGKKIESKAKEIFKLLRSMQTDYAKTNEAMDVLGKHITNASNQMANVNKTFSQIGQKLNSTKYLENQ